MKWAGQAYIDYAGLVLGNSIESKSLETLVNVLALAAWSDTAKTGVLSMEDNRLISDVKSEGVLFEKIKGNQSGEGARGVLDSKYDQGTGCTSVENVMRKLILLYSQ